MSIIYDDPHSIKTPIFPIAIAVTTFIIFGLPWILFIGFFSTIEIISDGFSLFASLLFLSSIGVVIAIVTYYLYSSCKTKKIITTIIGNIKKAGLSPIQTDEEFAFGNRKYIGIDTKSGSVLFASVVYRKIFSPFREVLVLGFNSSNWSKIELKGNVLTIYTREPDIPFVSFKGSKAAMFYEKLSIIRDKKFNYPHSIPEYVEQKAIQVTDKMGLDLILPRR